MGCKCKTVAVLGKGSQAVRVAQWFDDTPGWRLKYVVPVTPEPGWTKSLIVWVVDNSREAALVTTHEAVPNVDLMFSCFYNKRIDRGTIARQGMVLNLHNSLLPRHRGMNPINWALRNGERKHGVTIHKVTAEFDEGDILAQREFPISPEFDEVSDVYEICLAHGYHQFCDTMHNLEQRWDNARRQDVSQATYHTAADATHLGERSGWRRP